MATRLKNILHFLAVPAGGTVVLPHFLNVNNTKVVPDKAEPSAAGFSKPLADDTNVTVTNNGVAPADLDVLVEHWLTIDRVFGVEGQPALVPQPFVPGTGNAPNVSGLPYIGASYDSALNLDVYVDSVNGNDANSGLAPATALRTLRALQRKIPLLLFGTAKIRVHLAGTGGADPFTAPLTPATYTEGSLFLGGMDTLISNLVYRGPQMCFFVPTTGPASVAVNAVAPSVRVLQDLTPSAVGRRTIIDCSAAAPGWTPNDFRGSVAFLRVMRGANMVLFELPITENGVDFVVVDVAIDPGTIVAGDLAQIVRPSSIIVGESGFLLPVSIWGRECFGPGDGFMNPSGQGFSFERIQFGNPLAFSGIVNVSNTDGVGFDRCALGTGLIQSGGSVVMANSKAFGVGLQVGAGGILNGTFAFPRPDSAASPLPANTGTDTLLNSAIVIGAGVSVGNYDAGIGFLMIWLTLSVYDAPTEAIQVYAGSVLDQLPTPGGSSAALMGDSNGSVGLRCRFGGQAIVRGGTNTEITGAGGDLRVGNGAAVPYGVGVGGFEEVLGFNGNLHRVGGSTPTVPLGDMSRIATS